MVAVGSIRVRGPWSRAFARLHQTWSLHAQNALATYKLPPQKLHTTSSGRSFDTWLRKLIQALDDANDIARGLEALEANPDYTDVRKDKEAEAMSRSALLAVQDLVLKAAHCGVDRDQEIDKLQLEERRRAAKRSIGEDDARELRTMLRERRATEPPGEFRRWLYRELNAPGSPVRAALMLAAQPVRAMFLGGVMSEAQFHEAGPKLTDALKEEDELAVEIRSMGEAFEQIVRPALWALEAAESAVNSTVVPIGHDAERWSRDAEAERKALIARTQATDIIPEARLTLEAGRDPNADGPVRTMAEDDAVAESLRAEGKRKLPKKGAEEPARVETDEPEAA